MIVSILDGVRDEVQRLRFTGAATTGFCEPVLLCRLNKPPNLTPKYNASAYGADERSF
jgi:hypothetical protein